MSSFGGFLGGTVAALWYRQRKRVSLLVLGDILCFAFPSGGCSRAAVASPCMTTRAS
ncbi:MAG TPA: hypothetical protein VK509_09615 [Polyangiales bacterium]|nr:hypothetical protein [Polyangiales bacterium]